MAEIPKSLIFGGSLVAGGSILAGFNPAEAFHIFDTPPPYQVNRDGREVSRNTEVLKAYSDVRVLGFSQTSGDKILASGRIPTSLQNVVFEGQYNAATQRVELHNLPNVPPLIHIADWGMDNVERFDADPNVMVVTGYAPKEFARKIAYTDTSNNWRVFTDFDHRGSPIAIALTSDGRYIFSAGDNINFHRIDRLIGTAANLAITGDTLPDYTGFAYITKMKNDGSAYGISTQGKLFELSFGQTSVASTRFHPELPPIRHIKTFQDTSGSEHVIGPAVRADGGTFFIFDINNANNNVAAVSPPWELLQDIVGDYRGFLIPTAIAVDPTEDIVRVALGFGGTRGENNNMLDANIFLFSYKLSAPLDQSAYQATLIPSLLRGSIRNLDDRMRFATVYSIDDKSGIYTNTPGGWIQESIQPEKPTPTKTATSTPTVTATRTPTPSPTKVKLEMGGRDLRLTTKANGREFTWTGGDEDGSFIIRAALTSGAITILPPGGAEIQTSKNTPAGYFDSQPLPPNDLSCHILFPVRGVPKEGMGFSDIFCLFPYIKSGAAPENFSIGFTNPSTLRLSWDHSQLPGQRARYALVPFGGQIVFLPPDAREATINTKGGLGVVLVPLDSADNPIGLTDALFAIPFYQQVASSSSSGVSQMLRENGARVRREDVNLVQTRYIPVSFPSSTPGKREIMLVPRRTETPVPESKH